MYFGSLTRFGWVPKRREPIFINEDTATVFLGYKVMKLGVLICSQILFYVDLLRQHYDDVSVLK